MLNRLRFIAFLSALTSCSVLLALAQTRPTNPKPLRSSESQAEVGYELAKAPLELITLSKATSEGIGGKVSKFASVSSVDNTTPAGDALILLGRGYNTLTGRFRGNSVKDSPTSDARLNLGQSTEYSLTQIESLSDLRTAFGMSASASFEAFGGGGGGSFSYMREVALHRYSNYILVTVKVTNATNGLKEFLMRDDSIEVAKTASPSDFLDRFGDSFTVSTTTGGRFFAVLEFLSQDRAEQEAMRLELRAHAGSFSSETAFSESLHSLQQDRVTRIKVIKEGGWNTIPKDEDLITAARSFPNEVNPKDGHPIIFSFETLDYPATSNWYGRLPPSLSKQKALIAKLAADRDDCIGLKSDIEYIKENPFQFGNPEITALDSKLKTLSDFQAEIEETATKILEHPLQVTPLPEPKWAQFYPLPTRVNQITIPLKVLVFVSDVGELAFHDNEWAGNAIGLRRIMALSVSIEPKVPGLGIEYAGRFLCVGWGCKGMQHGKDGERITDSAEAGQPPGVWLTTISFNLTGPKAKYYDVLYQARYLWRGDTMVARNGDVINLGPPTPGTDGVLQIQALRVWVVAKGN